MLAPENLSSDFSVYGIFSFNNLWSVIPSTNNIEFIVPTIFNEITEQPHFNLTLISS